MLGHSKVNNGDFNSFWVFWDTQYKYLLLKQCRIINSLVKLKNCIHMTVKKQKLIQRINLPDILLMLLNHISKSKIRSFGCCASCQVKKITMCEYNSTVYLYSLNAQTSNESEHGYRSYTLVRTRKFVLITS